MVSIRPLTSTSYGFFINPLVTVPNTPIATGISVTFMFHCFYLLSRKARYISFFSLSSLYPSRPIIIINSSSSSSGSSSMGGNSIISSIIIIISSSRCRTIIIIIIII